MTTFRQVKGNIGAIVCGLTTVFVTSILFLIIGTILFYALPSLSLYFILTPENATPGLGQGIANAIIGTLLISFLSTMVATPLGIGTAIYLQRYAKKSRTTEFLRFLIEVLSGTPSIIMGIFGLLVLVYLMKSWTGGFTLISGTIALSLLIVPVIVRSVENAIESVPNDLEEGSYALGARKWQTVRNITLPVALPGIVTGLILAFGRAAEESAVVILTAGYSQFIPEIAIKHNERLALGYKIYPFQDLVGTLPYSVYHAFINSNVIPMSAGFAAAFVLICIVLTINFTARAILIYSTSKTRVKKNSIFSFIRKNLSFTSAPQKQPGQTSLIGEPDIPSSFWDPDLTKSSVTETIVPKHSFTEKIRSIPMKWLKSFRSGFNKKDNPTHSSVGRDEGKSLSLKQKFRTFLRALLPFTIPAALLLLIAYLTTIPPLHHALSPVSPSLARLFAIGLYLIVMIVSVVFGILLAKKAGVFKGKNRRIGFAGVATGICLLCIAGIICALAAPGIFSTGEQPLTKGTTDRKALLASLMAEFEEADGGTSSAPVDNALLSSSVPSQSVPGVNSSGGIVIPVKDALSLGESYQYGDATRTVEATVYDYTILPFYFWWFIDYNRFVQQIPQNGTSYLVVFIRIENTGTNSALVPSAEKIQISNNGMTYSHEPYFNTSVLSSSQWEYYADHYEQLPYQWVRELGQDKRDYAFLTGYNIFGGWNFVSNPIVTATTTVSTTTSTGSSSSNNGKGFFIKPGPGNAIDGYLLFEVPDSVVKQDIDKTYVDISFNANSGTRWRLK